MTIDKRIAEIIFSARNAKTGGEPDKSVAEWAEDVVRAVKEEGYYHSPLVSLQMKRIESGELMTGQEWYNKFREEVGTTNWDVIQAAKKAAGIK